MVNRFYIDIAPNGTIQQFPFLFILQQTHPRMDNFSFVMVVCPTKKGFPFTRQPVRTSHSSPPLSLSRSQHSVIEFCSPIEWAAQGKGMEGRGLSLNNTQVDRELS